MRIFKTIQGVNTGLAKQNIARFATTEACFCLLDSNDAALSEVNWLAGWGVRSRMPFHEANFDDVKSFLKHSSDWVLAHFSYDLKEQTDGLKTKHENGVGFSNLHLFCPSFLVLCKGNKMEIGYFPEDEKEANKYIEKIITNSTEMQPANTSFSLVARTSRAHYLETAAQIKKHIQRGDIYEINYCIEFFAEQQKINPVEVWCRLNALAEAPFAALYKIDLSWLICASPERFLKKTGNQLISQPIKGTRKRGKDEVEDKFLKAELASDLKERSENVMIVDLVRNDLSHFATRGSVNVPELFGVHTFKTVHQLISTITCELRPDANAIDALKKAFPMGSMTGAPKLRAMQLIDTFEDMRRGLYSGAVGYIDPSGNFDFNVVIRSIQYNEATHYVSTMVGSAYTQAAVPEQEYEECLTKAQSMFSALGGSPIST
ncbi:MAG: anthranilate synthase component I family protein [Bacteroidia bacterium]